MNDTDELTDADRAALAILDDLSGRKGIGDEIESVDDDIRDEIIKTIADIVRRVECAGRAAAIEECARLCDDMTLYTGFDCAAAIHALSSAPKDET